MKNVSRLILLTAAAVLLAGAPLFAANDTKTVNVSATVGARAVLTLGAAAVNFPDTDPDTNGGVINAAAIGVTAKARTASGNTVTLTVVSDNDLLSGTDSIAAANLTWTADGDLSAAGTMNKTVAQTLGSWTGSGNRAGDQSYILANSWAYAVGDYTMVVTYTLTAP